MLTIFNGIVCMLTKITKTTITTFVKIKCFSMCANIHFFINPAFKACSDTIPGDGRSFKGKTSYNE